MEANGDERGLEEESSDDEDDPLVSRDCDSYNFSQLVVNTGENVAWEYRKNAVSVGAMYKSVVEVKDVVKRWSTLTLQREFRVVKSSPHIYDVCLKPTCPFRVYASKGKWKIIGRSNLLWITLVYLSRWMQAIVVCHLVLWLAKCLLRLWKILLLSLSPLSWQLWRNLGIT
jgi:hypothetical protein